mmetsp:Transcript_174318/g.558791  ORF Transcript_174318/g.558791 Transcript_174318/m.558791 type:complete len:304 (+) Transcript_174318:2582-3493(+)
MPSSCGSPQNASSTPWPYCWMPAASALVLLSGLLGCIGEPCWKASWSCLLISATSSGSSRLRRRAKAKGRERGRLLLPPWILSPACCSEASTPSGRCSAARCSGDLLCSTLCPGRRAGDLSAPRSAVPSAHKAPAACSRQRTARPRRPLPRPRPRRRLPCGAPLRAYGLARIAPSAPSAPLAPLARSPRSAPSVVAVLPRRPRCLRPRRWRRRLRRRQQKLQHRQCRDQRRLSWWRRRRHWWRSCDRGHCRDARQARRRPTRWNGYLGRSRPAPTRLFRTPAVGCYLALVPPRLQPHWRRRWT